MEIFTICHVVLVKANRLILIGKGFLIHCTSLTCISENIKSVFILFGGSSFDRISVLTSLKSLLYCLVIS